MSAGGTNMFKDNFDLDLICYIQHTQLKLDLINFFYGTIYTWSIIITGAQN